jgi:hypothetical protein
MVIQAHAILVVQRGVQAARAVSPIIAFNMIHLWLLWLVLSTCPPPFEVASSQVLWRVELEADTKMIWHGSGSVRSRSQPVTHSADAGHGPRCFWPRRRSGHRRLLVGILVRLLWRVLRILGGFLRRLLVGLGHVCGSGR